MSRRNPALEAALQLCNGYVYRTQVTRDGHIKLMIDGTKKIVYISTKSTDPNVINNVKQDVRNAIRTIGQC